VTALVLGVLGASLLGSAHCAGMCGGFVAFYATGTGARRLSAHAAYHGGRWISYVLLGVLAGALGAGLDRAFTATGLAGGAGILSGALITAWGAAKLLRALAPRLWTRLDARTPRVGRGAGGLVAAALGRFAHSPPAMRALALGLFTTLLPCGWLYAFVATAAGTGSPARGALVMTAFWAGTLPMLALFGVLARKAAGPFARRLPLLSACLLVAVGLFTLAGRVSTGRAAHLDPRAAATAGESHACH
jgi:sulfite exporter TauE/SafE